MSEIDSSCLVGRPEDSPEGSINPGSLTSRAARLSVEDHRRRGITNEPEKWGRRQKPFSGGSSPHSANRRWLPPAVDSSRSKAIWPLITFRRYPWGTPARSSRAGSLNQTAVRYRRIEGGSGLGGRMMQRHRATAVGFFTQSPAVLALHAHRVAGGSGKRRGG
jgi:hypothetical protein